MWSALQGQKPLHYTCPSPTRCEARLELSHSRLQTPPVSNLGSPPQSGPLFPQHYSFTVINEPKRRPIPHAADSDNPPSNVRLILSYVILCSISWNEMQMQTVIRILKCNNLHISVGRKHQKCHSCGQAPYIRSLSLDSQVKTTGEGILLQSQVAISSCALYRISLVIASRAEWIALLANHRLAQLFSLCESCRRPCIVTPRIMLTRLQIVMITFNDNRKII